MWCTWDNEDSTREQPNAGKPDRVPDAVEFARTQLGFEPDEPQARVLRSSAKRGILNCTPQWGKSTVAVIATLHRATFQPGSFVVVASPGGPP